ncbi:hypothetical protein C8J57DRAFT_1530123 [Mycena rebaudengoi]|nr:hypothetical protein C8J57DRAFT_1530123 [Mycena rebaudengoi]
MASKIATRAKKGNAKEVIPTLGDDTAQILAPIPDNPDEDGSAPLPATSHQDTVDSIDPLSINPSEPSAPATPIIPPGNLSEAEDLEDFMGPLESRELDPAKRSVKGSLDLPTFQAYTDIKHDPVVLARRETSLDFRASAFAKGFLYEPRSLSRRLAKFILSDALACVETVISLVEVGQMKDGTQVYRVQKGDYWVLWKQLDDLRKRAKPALDIFGSLMPSMPTWGRSEDPLAYYVANNYEILGICYRVEVENYLATLAQYFDFSTNEPIPPVEEVQEAYNEYRRSS